MTAKIEAGQHFVHVIPKLYVLESTMPADMIESVNDYMDEYKAKKNKISAKSTLVGQIHKGEQLLLDHKDERMVEYNNLICNLGAEYINHFNATGSGKGLSNSKQVAIDETWSVHSYDGDYNPLHDHGVKTLMGLSTTAWTKVPPQIGTTNANASSYSLYNESGHCDGCISFQYGQSDTLDSERLKAPNNFMMTPEVGKLLVFPNWLQHMVYPFKGKGERRTIASNLNCWDVIQNEEIPQEVN